MNLRQTLFLLFVAVLNGLLWAIPSDVVTLIARDRHVLLGRYSREQFAWIIAAAVFTIVGLYVDWAPREQYKRRWFQVLATLLLLVPTLAVVDVLMRSETRTHYVQSDGLYARPAGFSFELVHEDKPRAARTYPHARGGYANVRCQYEADAQGYRRVDGVSPEDRVDVVVLGDSFAEGSLVSDEHVWVTRMADATGLTVRNLGMSGYGPGHYLEALRRYGLAHQPQVVVCMLYEGNDFRRAAVERSTTGEPMLRRLQKYVKQSPMVEGLDQLLIRTLGPIGSDWPVANAKPISWLPLAVPSGEDGPFYAFAPKQILQNRDTTSTFRQNEPWRTTAELLSTMRELCGTVGARLVIVLAPTKAHVVLPLVKDELDPEKIRAFAALRYDGLPTAERFAAQVFDRLSAKEEVLADWCHEHGVPFLSLTRELQVATKSGQQTYYTYDQHWTPNGHAVAASVIGSFVRDTTQRLARPQEAIEATLPE